jgi:hypothetical protein
VQYIVLEVVRHRHRLHAGHLTTPIGCRQLTGFRCMEKSVLPCSAYLGLCLVGTRRHAEMNTAPKGRFSSEYSAALSKPRKQ